MGVLFIKDGLVDPAIISVDSSLLKAKGHVWLRLNTKNEVPHSGIDTDARWGFSRTKGWIFRYKMHLACSTGSLIVPLSADFTTASITDNRMYESMTSSLPTGMVRYVVGDEGYDDHGLRDSSGYGGIRYSHWKGAGMPRIIIPSLPSYLHASSVLPGLLYVQACSLYHAGSVGAP